MRDLDRQQGPYNYRNNYNVYSKSRKKKNAGVSLGFCWGFGIVVALTFGLASFLMYSAGHFSFYPSAGAEPAWGGIEGDEPVITGNLITVEVTELEGAKDPADIGNLYVYTENTLNEEIGPLPRYLSDYESIILSVHEDGTKMPELDEDEEEIQVAEANVQDVKTAQEQPILVENATVWREHVVKNGETLSDIALAHGNITAQDILRANGLKDANRLSENQLLLIPNDPGKIEETLDEVRTRQMRIAATKEKIEPLKVKTYVVAQGDSLWSISNAQNIELDTLIGSNTFKSSARLRPGVKLRIPNQDGIFYVLKKGESLEEVSKRYGVSINKLKQVNVNVDVASLKTGDEVFLPGAKPEGLILKETPKVADAKKTPAPSKTQAKAVTPKAQPGDVAVKPGNFRWPIMGRINSPFGWRQHPITKRRDFHTGIDIKASRGDPIKAAGSGKIVYSGWMGGYGKVIVIEHSNGQSTLYAHCSTLLVGKGAGVSSGQLVAKVGTTGRSTGPHLHFEVRNGNSPVNPIKYLSK